MLPIKQLLPKRSTKQSQFQKDQHNLIRNLNKTYQPIQFDKFNINPYPLLFSKELIYQVNDCHTLLIEAIHKIVSSFFDDPILQEMISLNDTVLNLLYPLRDKPYEIGAIRPDFLFNENYQLKICEINARFPLNAFLFSQCLYTEIHKNFGNNSSYFDRELLKISNIFQNFFDSDRPVSILLNKEKSFDICLLRNILEKTSNLTVKQISPFNNQQSDHVFQTILNLHQEELVCLDSDLFKEITAQPYFNDIRTIFIVHDKRLLALLSNKKIMSKYISSEKCDQLANYIIPTYTLLNDHTVQNIKMNPKNWVLKKSSTGKGEGMYIGKEAQFSGILTVLNEKKLDYVVQPFINQPLFQLLNEASPNSAAMPHSGYQNIYLVGSILSFNNILLGPGIIRGSCKSIINIAQGGTTVFMPIC